MRSPWVFALAVASVLALFLASALSLGLTPALPANPLIQAALARIGGADSFSLALLSFYVVHLGVLGAAIPLRLALRHPPPPAQASPPEQAMVGGVPLLGVALACAWSTGGLSRFLDGEASLDAMFRALFFAFPPALAATAYGTALLPRTLESILPRSSLGFTVQSLGTAIFLGGLCVLWEYSSLPLTPEVLWIALAVGLAGPLTPSSRDSFLALFVVLFSSGIKGPVQDLPWKPLLAGWLISFPAACAFLSARREQMAERARAAQEEAEQAGNEKAATPPAGQ